MTKQKKRTYRTYEPIQRLGAVELYDKSGVRSVIESHHVPRSTIYRWVKLKQSGRKNWTESLSKCPKHLARKKTTAELVEQIISLKKANPQFLYKQIAGQLPIKISVPTICRVLKKYKQESKNNQP